MCLDSVQEQMEDLAAKAQAYRSMALKMNWNPCPRGPRGQRGIGTATFYNLVVRLSSGDGSSPFVLSTSYRIPKTPLQFVSRYEQGRANIMLTLTPDKDTRLWIGQSSVVIAVIAVDLVVCF